MLKEAAFQLSNPLSLIFTKSLGCLQSGRWLQLFPFLKKGNKASPSNYRLVSLTSIVSKVFESIVREPMMHHLYSNNLITSHQHGFLPRKSCVTQLLKAVEEWSESLDNGNSVDDLTYFISILRKLLTLFHVPDY